MNKVKRKNCLKIDIKIRSSVRCVALHSFIALSHNLQQVIDKEKTVDNNCNQESIQSDFNNWSHDFLQ